MHVNGQSRPHRDGLTLHALLAELGVDARSVVVMHGDLVHRAGQVPDAPPAAAAGADRLAVGGRAFRSRLMVGTGKYRDFGAMREAVAASGAEVVTVSIRRVELGAPGHTGILDQLDFGALQLLPNTAGWRTVDEAVRVARLARDERNRVDQARGDPRR